MWDHLEVFCFQIFLPPKFSRAHFPTPLLLKDASEWSNQRCLPADPQNFTHNEEPCSARTHDLWHRPGWLLSLWWLTLFFLDSADNVKCRYGCRWKYVRRIFFPPSHSLSLSLFLYESIKNWIISVSMVTSEYRRGKRALYFAIDPRLYLKERDILWEGSEGECLRWIKSGQSAKREGKEGSPASRVSWPSLSSPSFCF